MEYDYKNIKVEVLPGNTVLITEPVVIAIDPEPEDKSYIKKQRVSLVLISHDHKNHLNELAFFDDSVEKYLIGGNSPEQTSRITPGMVYITQNIRVRILPAYNVNKQRKSNQLFHSRNDNGVGFLLLVNGKKVYYTGHTEKIPEMAKIEDLDILIAPVSNKMLLTPAEVNSIAYALDSDLVIPIYPKNTKIRMHMMKEMVAVCDRIGK